MIETLHTLHTLHADLKAGLRAAGIEAPDREARAILTHRTGASWSDLIARPETAVAAAAARLAVDDLRRRQAGEPLARIQGIRGFGAFDFLLGPDTLDPRPETQTLVDAALRRFSGRSPRRILDLGTGSGCILVSLLHAWPAAFGIGVDRAPGACTVARLNADRAGVGARAAFLCGDWGESLSGAFDLIVSNPPYIRSGDIATLSDSVKNHDPILALDGGADGFEAIRRVITAIKKGLTADGAAFIEIGFDQSRDSERLVEDSGLNHIAHHADSAGIPRVVEMSRGDKCKNFLTPP